LTEQDLKGKVPAPVEDWENVIPIIEGPEISLTRVKTPEDLEIGLDVL
jgi:hypothetical protein